MASTQVTPTRSRTCAITVIACGESVRVRARGELDVKTAPELDAALRRVEAPKRRVGLDLSGVTFMDSIGIGLLMRHAMHAQRDGFTLWVIPPGPSAARALELTGVRHALPIVEAPRRRRPRRRAGPGRGMSLRPA
jgi:anti-anti-sigma factor